jgi:hypothetical protein
MGCEVRRYPKLAAVLLATHLAYSSGVAQVNAPAPAGWRKINANDFFTFYLPPNMKHAEDVNGIDSFVQEYRADGIVIRFDYGWYSGTLSDLSRKKNFRGVNTRIGGRRARVGTYHDPKREGLKYFAGVHFPLGGVVKLTMWAECEGPAEQETAKKVFYSIRFPKDTPRPTTHSTGARISRSSSST